MRHLAEQEKNWPGAYVQGYFYQGLEDIGISGGKPTRFRFSQYQVDDLLRDADVLDIGSNTGFVSIYCAKFAKSVLGIEFNPYLNKVARETAAYLGIQNTEFRDVDFADFQSSEVFDVVLSLSNHHTIDNNLDLGFESHVSRIAALLRPGGVMLFESHNVFAPGEGGPGDDGDMDEKVKIMSKYFQIERHRMVRCFLKYGDIDKLFIIARKTDDPKPISFDLETARQSYSWTDAKA
ncbi:MAG: class I SAM-dependent methyltransferase [Pseudomonadota bacterium]